MLAVEYVYNRLIFKIIFSKMFFLMRSLSYSIHVPQFTNALSSGLPHSSLHARTPPGRTKGTTMNTGPQSGAGAGEGARDSERGTEPGSRNIRHNGRSRDDGLGAPASIAPPDMRMNERETEIREPPRQVAAQPESAQQSQASNRHHFDMAESPKGFSALKTLRFFLLARIHFLKEQGYRIENKTGSGYTALVEHVFSNWQSKFSLDEGGSIQTTDQAQLNLMKLYRMLLRVVVRAAVQYSNDKRREGEPVVQIAEVGPYTEEQMNFAKDVLCKSSVAPGLAQIYKYAAIILPWDFKRKHLDTRAYDVYVAVNTRYGNDFDNMGCDGVVRYLAARQWTMKLYFEEYWFRAVPPHRQGRPNSHKFKPSMFLSFVKLAVDSQLFRVASTKKRRRAKADDVLANTRDKYTADVYASIGVAVEMIVHAWGQFAQQAGFENGIEELVSPFFYLDEEDCMLKVTDTDLCVPSNYNKDRLYVRMRGHEGTTGVPYSESDELKNMGQEISEKWRAFAAAFLGDLYETELWDEVIRTKFTEVAGLASMAKYTEGSGRLGSRFTYSDETIYSFRRSRLMAMIPEGADEMEILPDEDFRVESHPIANAGSEHTCGEGCDCRKVLDRVEGEILGYPKFYHASFKNLIQKIEADDTDIAGQVQLILSDPPYNVRRARGKPDSDYDSLSKSDIKDIAKICGQLLREGGHAIFFCSIEQFNLYVKAFEEEKTAGDTRMFTVTSTPLVFVPKPGTYGRPMNRTKLTYSNITEFAFHAARRGGRSRLAETINMVNWKHFGYVESTHAAHTNVIDGVRMERGERLTSGSAMVRPEQKSLSLTQELIERNTKEDDIVVDLFAGTGTTGLACVTTLVHREFYGCDVMGRVVFQARDRLRRAVVYRAGAGKLGKSLDVPEKEMTDLKMLYNRWGYDKVVPRGIGERSRGGVFVVEKTAIIQQVLELDVLKLLCVIHRDTAFLKMNGRRPETYEKGLLGKLNSTDVERLLESSLARYDLYVHDGDEVRGEELRAQRAFQKGAIVGHLFGCVFFGSWESAREGDKVCGTGIFEVDERAYQDYGFTLLKNGNVSVHGNTFQNAVLVPGRHCPFRYSKSRVDGVNCGIRLAADPSQKVLEFPQSVEVYCTKDIAPDERIVPSKIVD